MDCYSFERTNTMQWIWANAKQNFPHWPPKILLLLYMNEYFSGGYPEDFWGTWPWTQYYLTGQTFVVIQILAGVNCTVNDLAIRWHQVSHLTSTGSPTTMRFCNSHNIQNVLIKYAKGCTLQYYARWEMYNAWLGNPYTSGYLIERVYRIV